MKVKVTCMAVLFFMALQFSFAQEKTVTGTVKDAAGIGLPGVAVLVKGEGTGAQTDFDGNYSVKAAAGKVLEFSYLGMKTTERTIPMEGGNTLEINVVLEEDAQQLGEVVVTALGVTRDKQSIGYAAQSVTGESISQAGQQNALNALSGNVAGLQITSPSSMGGSTRIVLRGVGSVTGENRPLIVVDGVPLDNGNYNDTNTQRGAGGRDYGDASADINPDDIESVTVLRGGPAAALYGSRGGNGVILYTTKSGKNGRTDIDVKSGVTFESIYIYPNLQKLYGGGSSNTFETAVINGTTYNLAEYAYDESWGPRYDGTMYLPWNAFDPEFPEDYMKTVPWVSPENDVDKFFRTGVTYSNSVSFSRSVQDTNLRLSFANNQTEGVIPNSKLDRSNLNFNFNSKFTEKLRLDGSFNYVYTRGYNRPEQGYGSNSVAQKFWQWGQRQLDMVKLRDYKIASTGAQRSWNRTSWDDPTPVYSDNPYWVINENTSEDKRNRFFGNAGITYHFLPELYAVGKVYGDTYASRIWERVAIGSQALPSFTDIKRSLTDFTYEGRLHFDKVLSEDLSLNAFAGISRRERRYDYVYGTTVGGLALPNYYNLANSVEQPKGEDYQLWRRTNSVFGMVSLGYKNILFLEGTARNDWFSTVTKSVFYPSVTGSFVFSSLVKQPWLNFGKLRLGWAQVGNDTDPYRLETYSDVRAAFLSSPRYSNPDIFNKTDLLPEMKTTKEIGLELSLFSRRVGVDVTYYETITDDLIMPLSIDVATGYINKYLNGGSLENKGIELTLSVAPIRTDDFQWNVTWNFTKNNNKLLSLAETDEYQISNAPFKATLYAKVGEPYGQIYGSDFMYHDNGKRIVDASGRYVTSPIKALGSIIPDYNTGLRNTFTYKNASLSVLFDMQKGGSYYSTSHMWGMYSGMLEATAADGVRENGIVLDAVYADGSANTTALDAITWGADYYSRVDAQNVFDASYLKLREVTLSYKLPIQPGKHVKEVVFSAFGRNLWVTGLDWKGMDPENTSYGSGNIQGLEGGSLPSTRTYGMNVQIKL
ncbi:MAG: SusC/RagA family TonB-linked outer membrane protein [Capnocytophaga sp.]|nr:SusC/RagA family TonB-linked outer membrane protein [Capnocytophaga sp.]